MKEYNLKKVNLKELSKGELIRIIKKLDKDNLDKERTLSMLFEDYDKLKKSLDVACDYLDYGYNSLDDDKHEFNKEEWKEYLMNNCENQ